MRKSLQYGGKSRQARELLAGVYSGFTEGFGTADLAEAREMLDKLESAAARNSAKKAS